MNKGVIKDVSYGPMDKTIDYGTNHLTTKKKWLVWQAYNRRSPYENHIKTKNAWAYADSDAMYKLEKEVA